MAGERCMALWDCSNSGCAIVSSISIFGLVSIGILSRLDRWQRNYLVGTTMTTEREALAKRLEDEVSKWDIGVEIYLEQPDWKLVIAALRGKDKELAVTERGTEPEGVPEGFVLVERTLLSDLVELYEARIHWGNSLNKLREILAAAPTKEKA